MELIKDFYQNDTVFKPEHVNIAKGILCLDENDGAVLSGKTGTGAVDDRAINGWFVGYVENNGRVFVFATNIQGKDNANGSAAALVLVFLAGGEPSSPSSSFNGFLPYTLSSV